MSIKTVLVPLVILPILLCIGIPHVSAQKTAYTKLTGHIFSQDKQAPIELATIRSEENRFSVLSTSNGYFELSIPAKQNSVTLEISYIGKKTIQVFLNRSQFDRPLQFFLQENSLTLEEVDINYSYNNTKNSISSITYDEEAIERIQAFSLMDILNTLPGRQITPPNINTPQTLSLRNTLGGTYDLNNSLGIPIIMDGVALSNDANMQSRPVAQRGMAGSALPAVTSGNTADVPFRGIDLREIPVESIERIEVIQGIASAEYGEMTDGAIIVERKAGKSPWHFTTNINNASTNISLNKGFGLSGRWGGLSTDLNYAKSNSDPRDNVQEFRRYGLGIRWNTAQIRGFRNKLSLDFGYKNDDAKLDPDDASQRLYYARQLNLRLSNNLSLRLQTRFIDNITANMSYAVGTQNSYAQWLLNTGPTAYAVKDTTGVYEGYFINRQYLAVEEIIGRPVTASGNILLAKNIQWVGATHSFSYGLSANYSNNGGKGIIYDPERPRFVGVNSQNIRPYSFELTPILLNYGVFFTDNISYNLAGRRATSNLGVRLDVQNGSLSVQPRLNTQVQLNNAFTVAGAFGIASKSPTLAHRYPPPAWIDYGLITAQSGQTSLYLVHTERVEVANENLRPSRSIQAEVNINFKSKSFFSRLNAYLKANKDGFNSLRSFYPVTIADYAYEFNTATNRFNYWPTGTYTTYRDLSVYTMDNTLDSYTYGADWSVGGINVPAINTTLNTSTSYIISWQTNPHLETVELTAPVELDGHTAWYGLYEPLTNNRRHVITSRINSTTHIPKIGFVIMSNVDVFWANRQRSQHSDFSQPATGFINNFGERIMLTPDQQALFASRSLTLTESRQEFIYANLSISVAKEISKRIRVAITTYNTFNIIPERSVINPNNNEETLVRKNSFLSITGGISFRI